MKKVLLCLVVALAIQHVAAQSLLQYVQPLSGTAPSTTTAAVKHSEAGSEKNANTIPAVTLPFAMTQWSPQTRTTEVKCQPPYYYKDSLLSGFRATHWLSGSCTQDYGSFTIMPVAGKLKTSVKEYSEKGIYVGAESADKISNIVFDEVDVFINKVTAIPGGVYDRRPSQAEGFVKGSTSGFYFDKASGIRVRNSSVVWGINRPAYYAHALESYGVTSLKITGLDGNAAFHGKLKTKISK